MASSVVAQQGDSTSAHDRLLFLGCFVALITTSFGFILRAMTLEEWGVQFALSETQKGEIFGAGLWPFAISIVLFSLVIDKVGYGKAMVFAFLCHLVSVVMTVRAQGYWDLYWANFVVALGNGTVEAVINPVVATMFRREKTKWLNILHAGWPGGLVLGGVVAIALQDMDWTTKFWLILAPTIAYGFMLARVRFPVQERVAAGVGYVDMLRELGALGAFVVLGLVFAELGRVFGVEASHAWIAAAVASAAFGFFVKSLGQPLFFLLLLVMLPLASTELGTDGWITDLMGPEMRHIGLNAGWVLIYTSAIMMVLRFFAGPIVHRFSPLGLLMASSAVAAVGLWWLSGSAGAGILAAATLYGVGKTFFWPTMLGVVAEQFPKGGALTLNAIGGVGMIGAGIVGNALFGFWQDTGNAEHLLAEHPAIHAAATVERDSVFGAYRALDAEKVAGLPQADKYAVEATGAIVKKETLGKVALLPVGMLAVYLLLWLWFRSRGGYKPVELGAGQGH
jgi:MFS family permease